MEQKLLFSLGEKHHNSFWTAGDRHINCSGLIEMNGVIAQTMREVCWLAPVLHFVYVSMLWMCLEIKTNWG